MKTGEAQQLADQLAKETRKGGEPSGATIAALLGGVAVNIARIAEALERKA